MNTLKEAEINRSLVKTAIKSGEEAAGKAAPNFAANVKKLIGKLKVLLQSKATQEEKMKILKKKILKAGIIRDGIQNQVDTNPEWVKANKEFRKLVEDLKVAQGKLDKDSTVIDRIKVWLKNRADKRAWEDEQDIARQGEHAMHGRRYETRAEQRAKLKAVGGVYGSLFGVGVLVKIAENRKKRKEMCKKWSGNKQLCNLMVDLAYLKEVHTAITQASSHVGTEQEKTKIDQMLSSNMKKQNELTARIAQMKKASSKPIKEDYKMNKSEVTAAIKEVIVESGCSSIDEYIIHILEADDKMPQMHNNLMTKGEKTTFDALGLGVSAAMGRNMYMKTKNKKAGLAVMIGGVAGLAITKLIHHYTDNCRKMAKAGSTPQQKKVMYYGCQVSACKKIIQILNASRTGKKDYQIRGIDNNIKMWNARLEEKQSLLKDALKTK